MAGSETQSSADKEEQDRQKRVFKDIRNFNEAEPETAVVLNFKDMQLLRIKDLQQKLFDHHMRFRVGGIAPERYEDALKSLDEDLLAYSWFLMLSLTASSHLGQATRYATTSISRKTFARLFQRVQNYLGARRS